ncbi:MAG TPA: ABC transporter ATP-binding protein [Candidatus Pullilachnospira intestinigallinarum]|nr:ABC transporter ATP-binding protein [Candidatus Pullilachnospira intestinigallinarum]
MLALDHVEKHYGHFSLDASLAVREGCVTGLIGQNGAGKSTTFKAILGLIFEDGGRVEIFGKPKKELSLTDREKIGVVLGESGFNEELTIRQVAGILRGFYRKFDRERFLSQCRKYQLPQDRRLKEFSTGMKARLKVVAATSYGAQLLILDEPTAGLDVVARDAVLDLLRAYMEEDADRSILISSHISGDLEGLCDDLYMIHEGKMLLHEDTDVLLGSYGIIKADENQYRQLDKEYLLRAKHTGFGWECLTAHRDFYMENYPNLVVEKGTIDGVITLMTGGTDAPCGDAFKAMGPEREEV